MSNIKEIIIDFVKNSYPVKLEVLAQTVSRKTTTFNYNLFEILDELIKEKKIYVLKNDEIYFIFPESIEIVTSMFNTGKYNLYTISITKDNYTLDIGFDYLPCLADLIDKISSLKYVQDINKTKEIIELLMNVNDENWPETGGDFCGYVQFGGIDKKDIISISFFLNYEK